MALAGERGNVGLGARARMPAIALVLLLLLVGEAAQEALGIGGSGLHRAFDEWVHDLLFFAAAGLCLARAAKFEAGREAWGFIGLALLAFAIGELSWSIFYSTLDPVPFPTASDAFWLAYFPLVAVGLAFLVHDRIEGFELHRWIDGIAAALIVATPAVALVFTPVVEHSKQGSTLGRAIELAYPIGDIVVVGAVIGTIALTAWRPGRTWLLLGFGLILFAAVDSVNSVQTIEGIDPHGSYDFVWTAGALIIAYAAWQPYPPRERPVHLTGWREVALPIGCQIIAAAIQFYGLFHPIPTSERVMTLAVLMIVLVQLWVGRPRSSP
jgi:hypothetical protein